LERRGLAKRVQDPDDKRARLVELTPAGADAAAGYLHGILGWFGEALAGWSADDLSTLGALLSRLIDDLSAHAARTANPADGR
jgi:DNA-binding MarR family transcriptional regulator